MVPAVKNTSPWGENGELRFPDWIERAGSMPATEPIWYFWALIGKQELDRVTLWS